MAVTTSIISKISSIQKHLMNIFCAAFHTNPLTALEIADRNSFMLFNKTGSVHIKGNTQTRWGKHCCHGKPVGITFSECVSVALFSLQLRRMLRITLPSVAWPERCVHRVLVGKPEGRRPLGSPRRRWDDNIKMDLQEVGRGGGDWMERVQDRDRWWALVGMVMNFRVP
jgi:hypothetical protein